MTAAVQAVPIRRGQDDGLRDLERAVEITKQVLGRGQMLEHARAHDDGPLEFLVTDGERSRRLEVVLAPGKGGMASPGEFDVCAVVDAEDFEHGMEGDELVASAGSEVDDPARAERTRDIRCARIHVIRLIGNLGVDKVPHLFAAVVAGCDAVTGVAGGRDPARKRKRDEQSLPGVIEAPKSDCAERVGGERGQIGPAAASKSASASAASASRIAVAADARSASVTVEEALRGNALVLGHVAVGLREKRVADDEVIDGQALRANVGKHPAADARGPAKQAAIAPVLPWLMLAP